MSQPLLDPSPNLAGAELTPDEQALADRIDHPNPDHSLVLVAAGLGAAFLLYHRYLKRRLNQEMKDKDPSDLSLVAQATANAFIPRWVQLVAPHLVAGYLEGLAQAQAGDISQEYLLDIAEGYAAELGASLNEVTIEAAVSGFHAQVNRKVPPRKALSNVVHAIGTPPRTMNSLVTIWTGEDPKVLSASPVSSRRDAKADAIIDKALATRAHQIGENEAWTARSQAKQLVWMYGIQKGTIPPEATRVWRTAKDERVCAVCGPLHKVEVPIAQPFVTDAGKFWSPPTHPNCRCDIDLAFDVTSLFRPVREEELVGKNFGDDPYDRDRHGRFSRQESRSKAKPKLGFKDPAPRVKLTPITIPDVVEGQQELPPLPGTLPPLPGVPVSLGRDKLGRSSLKRVSLNAKTSLSEVGQEKTSLDQPKRGLPKVSLPKARFPSDDVVRSSLGMDKPAPVPPGKSDRWVVGEMPLYTVLVPGFNRSGDLAHIDQDQLWVKNGMVPKSLQGYWESWVDQQLGYFDAGDLASNQYHYTDPRTGRTWMVNRNAYAETLNWYLHGDEERDQPMIEVYRGPETGQYETKLVPAGVLSDAISLSDEIDEATPTIMVSDYINVEDGEIHDSRATWSARNPGTFRAVSARNQGGNDFSKTLPYDVVYFEPNDLFDF